jgi:hypothetical protein
MRGEWGRGSQELFIIIFACEHPMNKVDEVLKKGNCSGALQHAGLCKLRAGRCRAARMRKSWHARRRAPLSWFSNSRVCQCSASALRLNLWHWTLPLPPREPTPGQWRHQKPWLLSLREEAASAAAAAATHMSPLAWQLTSRVPGAADKLRSAAPCSPMTPLIFYRVWHPAGGATDCQRQILQTRMHPVTQTSVWRFSVHPGAAIFTELYSQALSRCVACRRRLCSTLDRGCDSCCACKSCSHRSCFTVP